jgi:hypothetical protein
MERTWASMCKKYKKQSVKNSGLNHAWVVDVADPTNGNLLPPGHVFITGFHYLPTKYKEVLVTQSPCLLPTDERKCAHVTTNPDTMSNDDWVVLMKRPYLLER